MPSLSLNALTWVSLKIIGAVWKSVCFHCIWFIHWYASFKIFVPTVWIPLANRGWSCLRQRYDVTPQSAVRVFIILSKHHHVVQVYTPNYLFFLYVRCHQKSQSKLAALYFVSMHIKPKGVLFNVAFQFCLRCKGNGGAALGLEKNNIKK